MYWLWILVKVPFPNLAPGGLGQSALAQFLSLSSPPLPQTLSLLHSLPSSEASQCILLLLLLLLLMLLKEPLPRGVHAWRPHAWPHGHVPTTIGRTRQLTPH